MGLITLIVLNYKYNREMIFDGVISIKAINTTSGYFLYNVKYYTKDGDISTCNISSYNWDEIKIIHQ